MLIFFLYTKDDVQSLFMRFINMVEHNFNVKLKSVQIDGDGEFSFLPTQLANLGLFIARYVLTLLNKMVLLNLAINV